tara:strand:+ start:82 stop:624 length:543 start_codon:yes stop_codon:yes gene_type:complete
MDNRGIYEMRHHSKPLVIKNIFTNEQRKDLIEYCQPLLLDQEAMVKSTGRFNSKFPGKQTLPLEDCLEFMWAKRIIVDTLLDKMGWFFKINSSWINWTNGKARDITWHRHYDVPYSAVYYIKTFPLFSNGTLFRRPIGFVKAPQNSIMVFPSNLEHTAPSSPLPFSRYTMAFDLELCYRR